MNNKIRFPSILLATLGATFSENLLSSKSEIIVGGGVIWLLK